MSNKKSVRIFTMEQEFPCGPESGCCGPVGQTKEEVLALKKTLKKLDAEVGIQDVRKTKVDVQKYPAAAKLLSSFGAKALPLITVDKEVVSMGQSNVEMIVSEVKVKL